MRYLVPIAAAAIAAIMITVGIGYAVTYYGQALDTDNDSDYEVMEVYVMESDGEPEPTWTKIDSGLTLTHPNNASDTSQLTGYRLHVSLPTAISSATLGAWMDCDPLIWIVLDHVSVTLNDHVHSPVTLTIQRNDTVDQQTGDVTQSDTGRPSNTVTVYDGDYDMTITFVYTMTYSAMLTNGFGPLFEQHHDVDLKFILGSSGVYKS